MTMLEMEEAPLDLLEREFKRDLEVPCEATSFIGERRYCDSAARWVLYLKPCCAWTPKFRLYCDRCKDDRVENRLALQCSRCNHVWMDASDAYYLIEAL